MSGPRPTVLASLSVDCFDLVNVGFLQYAVDAVTPNKSNGPILKANQQKIATVLYTPCMHRSSLLVDTLKYQHLIINKPCSMFQTLKGHQFPDALHLRWPLYIPILTGWIAHYMMD